MTQLVRLIQHPTLDAHQVYARLWQGGRPPTGSALQELGFHILVLCAWEHQPLAINFPGVQVIYAPNEDSDRPPSREELQTAMEAVNQVLTAHQDGKQILVTCWAGRNRSGLVSALTLHKLLGISGSDATTIIQMTRPKALTNTWFQVCLARLRATRSAKSKL